MVVIVERNEKDKAVSIRAWKSEENINLMCDEKHSWFTLFTPQKIGM